MKTKLVYAVTSDKTDIYLEQTLVSIYSARLHNPNSVICLIVDNYTNDTIVGNRGLILKYIDQKCVVPVPKNYSKKLRSRYVKTSIREIINGDFLFIDGDTIITEPLSDIDNFNFEIGAVIDYHIVLSKHANRDMISKDCARIGIMAPEHYFNSGVIYCKDSSCTHRLFNEWHNAYCNNIANGVSQDQPTLALADRRCGYIIHELDGIWNCQVKRNGLRYLNRAKIIHYFGSESKAYTAQIEYLFCSDELYWKVAEEGYITPEIKSMVSAAKSAFPEQVQLCAGEFLATQVFKRFRYLFYQHRKLFNVLNNLVSGMFSCARVFAKNRVKQL